MQTGQEDVRQFPFLMVAKKSPILWLDHSFSVHHNFGCLRTVSACCTCLLKTRRSVRQSIWHNLAVCTDKLFTNGCQYGSLTIILVYPIPSLSRWSPWARKALCVAKCSILYPSIPGMVDRVTGSAVLGSMSVPLSSPTSWVPSCDDQKQPLDFMECLLRSRVTLLGAFDLISSL